MSSLSTWYCSPCVPLGAEQAQGKASFLAAGRIFSQHSSYKPAVSSQCYLGMPDIQELGVQHVLEVLCFSSF